MAQVIPVILAGGTGSRLWPLSRELFPKQFHALFSDRSLLQETIERARSVTDEAPIIVCNEEHRFLVAEQCRALGIAWRKIILEPEGRNTAPAIGLAAHAAPEGAILLVLPSDHLIRETGKFAAAVERAVEAADRGGLVTFGLVPSHAETGYGYIQAQGEGAEARPVPKPIWRNCANLLRISLRRWMRPMKKARWIWISSALENPFSIAPQIRSTTR
jgi:mannose-1-phosphate guanylyltransferase